MTCGTRHFELAGALSVPQYRSTNGLTLVKDQRYHYYKPQGAPLQSVLIGERVEMPTRIRVA